MKDPVAFLNDVFRVALATADPLKTVPPHLPEVPEGRLIVIGAGKASALMAKTVEDNWHHDKPLQGLIVTQYGYKVPTKHIEIVEAAHPVPDDAGENASRRILGLVQGLKEKDLVLCLLSGGGSALMSLPARGISSETKRAVHKSLVRSGAGIHEINCVRKHLSAIKGGRLGLATYPAQLLTLIISDVPGDDPHIVASGPTLPDATTSAEALAILEKYKIAIAPEVRSWLNTRESETPKPGDPRFAGHVTRVISCGKDMLAAATAFAGKAGIAVVILGENVEGEARTVGREHAAALLDYKGPKPCLFLSAGETTVTVSGSGKGGRNSEYLLAAAETVRGHNNIYGLACATDGMDGNGGVAGACFTPKTLQQAAEKNITPEACFSNNNTFVLFEATGGLVVTGPTYTNVNDFRALLVL